jgi:predicted flap endonuclease-1-like 5' DNA nuclease
MTWLLAHMWIVVAATGSAALILGWSVRGMMLSGKMRQALVERDMVRVELGHAKDEIERLFADQRKRGNGEVAAAPAADPILARKVESLTAELARKSAEIDALKAAPAPAAVAAPAVAAAATATSGAGQVEETLVWRNRHLESRVVHLESELAKAVAAPPPAAPAAPAAAPAEAAEETAKKDFEISYLRTRVAGLEAELAAAPAPTVAAEAPAEPVAAPAAETAAPVEEEIARLRWRVRFLEGRLAYFEGDGEKSESADESEDSAEAGFEKDAEPEPAPRASDKIFEQLEAADQMAEAEAAPEIARERPLAMERPVDGKPDDLTLIGGIGPKIQDVLNSLGIWHFDQIAEWTPQNIAWVDEYLSFAGRITREGWVEQAAVLVDEAADA